MVRGKSISFFKSRAWRWIRRTLYAVSATLVILLIVAVLTILLAPGRKMLLGTGIDLALEKIPGTMTGKWSWPSLIHTARG